MKVYIAVEGVEYECETITGVFSDKEKAITVLNNNIDLYVDYIRVYEVALDTYDDTCHTVYMEKVN